MLVIFLEMMFFWFSFEKMYDRTKSEWPFFQVKVVFRAGAIASFLNSNNQVREFLGDNHYSLEFSRSASWILALSLKNIKKLCQSYKDDMKPPGLSLVKLRIFDSLKAVSSEAIPWSPLYCGCLVMKSTMTFSTIWWHFLDSMLKLQSF